MLVKTFKVIKNYPKILIRRYIGITVRSVERTIEKLKKENKSYGLEQIKVAEGIVE